MNGINDDRLHNAIGKATRGEEWECDKESIFDTMLKIKKLSEEILKSASTTINKGDIE